MHRSLRKAAILLLAASIVGTFLPSTRAHGGSDEVAEYLSALTAPQKALLDSPEPTMRIALSTDARAVTISTTAQLLNASELNTQPQPLETSRVRIESRLLSPGQQTNQNIEVEVARSLSRDDADRLIDSVLQLTKEEAQAVAMTGGMWRVVLVKSSIEAAEAAVAALEGAGFEATTSFQRPAIDSKPPDTVATKGQSEPKAPSNRSVSPGSISRVRLTSRAAAANREVIAYTRGTSFIRSSAPLTFASSDEANSPVRFNDKPFRGRIEVFANTRGSMTVVNVIGLEDYVRGVVPNELSFPALEALKAQAVAARTYALKNRGQFAPEGFDLLPTTRSQVYRGLTSETPLTTRAVDETRGVVATYQGEPINALYTSTCGGRTEDVENIFNDATPYLRGRECAAEVKAPFAPFLIKSSRDLFDIKDEKDLIYARDAALLLISGFNLPVDRVSSSWLGAHLNESDSKDWLNATARLFRNPSFKPPHDPEKLPEFSSGLISAVYGEKRADVLLNSADISYYLSFRDADEIPSESQADIAMLVRDGALSLYPDATLRPKEAVSRGRALHAIVRILETKGLLALQKGNTKPAANGVMVLRSNKSKEQPIVVSRDAFLFREFGESLYQMKSMALVGGEPVTFHLNARGEVDYLEVRPANDGASAERFSPFTNWTTQLSLGQVQARLSRSVRGVGAITDLKVARRGSSRRVIDLEVVGTQGTGHVRGGRIRSALGLREQLFVIDRVYSGDRVAGFVFVGRGWGHGVGMCQYGAYGLAKQGLTVDQILKTYYTGIDLTKLYN
ncbi:MAG TPA: SpoIID/LytB domain-containing protein [Pyrinomonadaceae bacterium]|nr:SpoIID/LytB domain-containing protein [Pyrinomonadaceae bacterium]